MYQKKCLAPCCVRKNLSPGGCRSPPPPGGVAILWHKRLESLIKPIDIKLDFVTAIQVQLGSKKFVIFNVYMPYQCELNEAKYIDCLGAITSAVDEVAGTSFVVIGDWNVNTVDGGQSLFARHLTDFCHDHNYMLSSKILLPDDSYTYVSCA